MLCLHGEPVGTSTTVNGTFWFCKQPSTCHLLCSEDNAFLYDKAVKEFLATNQPRPMCCSVEDVNSKQFDDSVAYERNYAKMKVVTDMEKASFGRPFFVCSKENGCKYFEWGDERIIAKPLCKHGKPSKLLKVKKKKALIKIETSSVVVNRGKRAVNSSNGSIYHILSKICLNQVVWFCLVTPHLTNIQ